MHVWDVFVKEGEYPFNRVCLEEQFTQSNDHVNGFPDYWAQVLCSYLFIPHMMLANWHSAIKMVSATVCLSVLHEQTLSMLNAYLLITIYLLVY